MAKRKRARAKTRGSDVTRMIPGEMLGEAELANVVDTWIMAAGRFDEMAPGAGDDIRRMCLYNARRLMHLTNTPDVTEKPGPNVRPMAKMGVAPA